jgi:hypothetical protein
MKEESKTIKHLKMTITYDSESGMATIVQEGYDLTHTFPCIGDKLSLLQSMKMFTNTLIYQAKQRLEALEDQMYWIEDDKCKAIEEDDLKYLCED